MVQKRRTSRRSSLIYLIIAVIITSTLITFWRFTKCPDIQYYDTLSSLSYLILPPENSTSPYRPKVLQENDFTKLIDLDHFTFLMNHSCNGSGPLLLVLVHSHPAHDKLRKTIRQTWGSIINSQFKLLFLVGIPKNKKEQALLTNENEENRDLVQGNFIDAYRNLTYKHVMAFKWALYFCPNAKYVLKCDDDVFVNTPGLINYIYERLSPFGARKLILCQILTKSIVYRTSRSKWKVAYSDYERSVYPPYCAGFFIIYSPDVVFDLYEKAQSSRYFWIDDVHITGFMARKAKINIFSIEEVILGRSDLANVIKNNYNFNSFVVGPPNLYAEEINSVWKAVTNSKNLTTMSAINKTPKR